MELDFISCQRFALVEHDVLIMFCCDVIVQQEPAGHWIGDTVLYCLPTTRMESLVNSCKFSYWSTIWWKLYEYIEWKLVQISSGAGPAGMLGHSSMDGKANTELQNWIQIFSLILPLPS